MTRGTGRPTRSGIDSEDSAAALERGRAAYASQAWQEAFEVFSNAELVGPLEDQDLERLAWASVLAGHDEAHLVALERLHDLRADSGDPCPAARAAFWLGMRLLTLGEIGRATGWLGRAEHLIENEGDCAERGYLLIPRGYVSLFRKKSPAEASDAARLAAEIGDRVGDPDLASLARMLHGQALAALGDHDEGLALLDESMLAATRGLLSPLVTGIVYCAVIGCCQRLYAVDRAREWTVALDAWRRSQPQLVAFGAACLVHRSEIMQLQGAWQQAIDEARTATQGPGRPYPDAVGPAWYQQGEILRLRGEFEAGEIAYRNASQKGHDPQPGLALLRLARGETAAAAAAIRHAADSAPDAFSRARYLPAAVEILLAAGDEESAERATLDLETVAAGARRNEILDALASHARGSMRAAGGDARGALEPLRRAFSTWQRVGAPYLAARLRAEIARVLVALGDEDGAQLERDAARVVFVELGAGPDVSALDPRAHARAGQPFGLTAREMEVLRLLATGQTNRAISEQLFLSEKTIDRHVSNIFSKLDVATRAAATAFAYQRKLV